MAAAVIVEEDTFGWLARAVAVIVEEYTYEGLAKAVASSRQRQRRQLGTRCVEEADPKDVITEGATGGTCRARQVDGFEEVDGL